MNNKHAGFVNHHRLALAVFTLLATLFLWDVLFLDYSLGAFDIILNQPSWKDEFPIPGVHQPILSDSPTAHYPQRELEWGHVKSFNNVEYNPYMFTGMPWSPQGVGGFITSLPQLFLDIKNAIDWSTWFRLILCGFFMYLLMLELGVSRMSGIFAGILWTYSLHQIVWLEFPQHLATQLWIPLVLLFNIRILTKGADAFSVVALLLVNVLFFTSGYMQIVLYTYVTIGLFNSIFVLANIGKGKTIINTGRWAAVHSVYLGAVLICAFGLYAEAQSISEGLRGAQDWRGRVDPPGLNLETFTSLLIDFFPKVDEVTRMLAPNYYGGFWEGRYRFEHGNIVESSRYFGILGVLFAVTALFAAWRTRHARMVFVFAAVIAVVFSLVYRNDTTISALRLIPFADKGSYSRFITLLTFIGCVLAGYGFHCVLGRRYKWLLAAVAAVGAYVIAAWMQLDDFTIRALWYPAAIVLALTAVIAARHAAGFDWKWIGSLVIVVSAADLLYAGYGFNTRMENERLFPTNNTIRYLLNDPEPYRVAVIADKPLYHPNVLSYYDIPVVEGYLTVLPVDYAYYMDELFPDVHVTRNGIMFLLEPNVQALRLLNVKYVLSDKPLERKYDGLERVLESNNHSIFRVENHLPRIYCASDVFYVKDKDEHFDEYGDRLGKYGEPLVLEGDDGPESYDGPCRVGELQVYTHGLNAVVESATPRYLSVPYSFNPNWRASINGEPAEIMKANGYHMAVRIPPGESTVEIRYRNRWQMMSGWVFVLASLGLLVFAWYGSSGSRLQRLLLTAVGLVVIFKSSLSLPLVRHHEVPERAVLEEPFTVLRQGPGRTERESYGERISEDNPVEYPLHVESKGLTRLSLLAGTFHQRRLEQAVTVEILDDAGNVLVEAHVDGKHILNNSWFTIDFPPIEQETRLSVRVSTLEPDLSKSFVLWFDENEEVCVMSFYRLEP